MDLTTLLREMIRQEASDLFLTTNAPPSVRIHGQMQPLKKEILLPGVVRQIAWHTMDAEQIHEFEKKPEMNLALSVAGVGRFRINIFRQRNEIAMVIRHIKTEIPAFESLGLPEVLAKLVMQKRGLVLIVGATGSGKSTTLASLIDYRNSHSTGHIITIEDPVEFIHRHKKCIVNQREVGVDTDNYEDALNNTLRQSPDVILIGEIRTREAMEHALSFAETGHLCLATLHATSANQALERILNFFPEERGRQVLLDLSMNLRGIVSQRLIPTLAGKRAAAVEVLLMTPLVTELIKKGDVTQLKEVMARSEHLGMQTFDSALYSLYQMGRISVEEALRNADSRSNLKLRMTLGEGQVQADDETPVRPKVLLELTQQPVEALPDDESIEANGR